MSAAVAALPNCLPAAATLWLADWRQQQEARAAGWDQLPASIRERALHRLTLVALMGALRTAYGLSHCAAALHMATALARGDATPAALAAARALARGGKPPGWQSLLAWMRAHDQAGGGQPGRMALADKHKGRQRRWHGWEPAALAYWLQPMQPRMGTVAFWLRRDGHASASGPAVRRFLGALPAHLGALAPQRLGVHHHHQNVRPYRIMDWSALDVGQMYEADGHCCDFYVLHPATGRHCRPELTVFVDKRSQYVVGWFLWNRESGLNTLVTLARVVLAHDHVPAIVHTDPGSGFVCEMISGEHGVLERLGIELVTALPGNARGKGHIEGFFAHFEERCGKTFTTHFGVHRTDDALRRLEHNIRRGLLALPSWGEALERIGAFMDAWNREPSRALDGQSRADLWARLKRVPLHDDPAVYFRPRREASVRQSRIQLDGQIYGCAALAAHDGRRVLVDVDPTDYSEVWVYGLDQRFIARAARVLAVQPAASMLERAEQKRLAGQRHRLEAKAERQRLEAGLARTHADHLADLRGLLPGAAPAPAGGLAPDAQAEAAADAAITAFQARLRQQQRDEAPETNGAA